MMMVSASSTVYFRMTAANVSLLLGDNGLSDSGNISIFSNTEEDTIYLQ